MLTVRLGLAGEQPLTLKQAAKPLVLSLDRIRQIQVFATNAIVAAAAGDQASREARRALREPVEEALRRLAE